MPGLSPRRVLLTADAVGGVWRYALELAAGFAERGIETVIAVLGPVPNEVQREEAGTLKLIGAYFAISDGILYLRDEAEHRFSPA